MARSSKIQRLLGPDWSIKFMKADGDCYYAAISAALELPADLGRKIQCLFLT